MAAVWSAGFVLFWIALWTVIRLVDPPSIDSGEGPLALAPLFAALGAIAGTVFGVTLSFGERKRTLADLKLSRIAMWGAIGGAALPLLLGKPLGNLAVFAPLGALLATGSLALARRAARAELPPGEPDHLLPR
ncbi:MAG: hypothetical protein JNJ98_10985 [Gemmatimonadetes bacterium]|nr:hypothetical protein [Gemmatimonadota bacterium]